MAAKKKGVEPAAQPEEKKPAPAPAPTAVTNVDYSAVPADQRVYLYAVKGLEEGDAKSPASLKKALIESGYATDYDQSLKARFGVGEVPESLKLYTTLKDEHDRSVEAEKSATASAARAQAGTGGTSRKASKEEAEVIPAESRSYVSVVKDRNSDFSIDKLRQTLSEVKGGQVHKEAVDGQPVRFYVDARNAAAVEAAKPYQGEDAAKAQTEFQEKLAARGTGRAGVRSAATAKAGEEGFIYASSVADPIRNPSAFREDMTAINKLVGGNPEKAGKVIRVTAAALENARLKLDVAGQPRSPEEVRSFNTLTGQKNGWERGLKVLSSTFAKVHGPDALEEEMKKGNATLQYLPKEVQDAVRAERQAQRDQRDAGGVSK